MVDVDAIKDELKDILDTARAVRGDDFADFAAFLGNCNTATKIVAMAVRSNPLLPEDVADQMGNAFCKILSELCATHADALDLSEDLREEAMTLVDNIENKMRQRIREARDVDS